MGRRREIRFQILFLGAVLLTGLTTVPEVLFGPAPILEAPGLGISLMIFSFIPLRVLRIWQVLRPGDMATLRDAQATVTLREGFPLRVCVAIGGLGMLAAGGLPMLGRPVPDVPVYVNVILAVMGVFVIASALVSRRAHLTLSPDGVDWSQITPQFMPWSDVKSSATRRWLRFGAMVVVQPKQVGKYFPKRNRKRVCPSFGILPFTFGIDSETLAQAIELRRMHSEPQALSTGTS